MRRIAMLILLALLTVAALVPVVHGQEAPSAGPPAPLDPAETTPLGEPPPADEPPSLPPLLIPDGVTIGSVAVGGFTVEQARSAVETEFAQPLEIVHKRLRWLVGPERLGARPRIEAALAQALNAPPGSQVELLVTVRGQDVRDYVTTLQRRVNREPRDARLRLVKLRPRITEGRPGLTLLRNPTVAAIVQALRDNERGPVQVETDPVRPKITAGSFGPIVVIRRESKRLFLYRGEKHRRTFRVATGTATYPTPIGRFSIVTKQRNPWWYPPASDWAEGLEPVPPGPGNPLGTRWMGLSAPLVGIHGTPDAASIGYSASHGCIRMLVSEAEWLFDRVRVGTTVFIVRA
jgi:lipoprotein-anchoring transpeptidase ErfK/SrfK